MSIIQLSLTNRRLSWLIQNGLLPPFVKLFNIKPKLVKLDLAIPVISSLPISTRMAVFSTSPKNHYTPFWSERGIESFA